MHPPGAAAAFPIVGIGASAGGLEAFTELLRHLPLDTGMGFVLVQHLDPVRHSSLTELLAKATRLPVCEVTRHSRVEPNHIYVISPNTNLVIAQGVLKPRPRQKTGGAHRSADFFLESLAQDQHERAIGVILSGAASDGTLGLETIKAEGGITFAQDESARYDSMPRSAVTAGCVDFVLSPEKIAKELARIAKNPYAAGLGETIAASEREERSTRIDTQPALMKAGGLKRILLLLRNHCSVDFSLYKSSTIQRRIHRRMVMNKLHTLAAYARFLRGNAAELDALYSDVLISVTGFFRNAEAFDVLQRTAFPKLIPEGRDAPVRVWVLGCSTGQEAYSIAMAFTEFFDGMPHAPKLQIFATDLNDALLDKARAGIYAKSLVQDVSPERLRRFFIEEEDGYRVVKPLRDAVVFARQNLISDPPFSRMDLISCRNLLIYIEPSLQKKILATFHYALRPNGFLFLGAGEAIGGFTDLFQSVDRKHRIYSRKPGPSAPFHLQYVTRHHPAAKKEIISPFPARVPENFRDEINVQREADRVTLNRYSPTGVLVNADLQVLQFRGETSAFLKPPTGQASFNVLKMAREGLMLPLRAAINRAKKENKTVRKENVRVNRNGRTRVANFEVTPLKNLKERCYLIFFEDGAIASVGRNSVKAAKPAAKKRRGSTESRPTKNESRRIAELESDLAETRDYLQSLQEQQEAAHEELQASNEEVTSANEELQSTNEELETSKEELESANEELTTVNEEMANRNAELNSLNSDLLNLQTSTHLAIVLLGRDLTIRRFTAQAEEQFNLLAGDVGRPFSNVRHNLDLPDLEGLVAEVIDSAREREHEVRDKGGRSYSLRVRPYLTLENKIDGAVLVLVDITDLKQTQREITEARDYAESIIRTARDPMLVLGADLRVVSASEAFSQTFKLSQSETEGRLIYEVGNGEWNIPRLRHLLQDIIRHNSFFNDFEVTHDFEQIGRRTMLLNARILKNLSGQPAKILVGFHDITARTLFEAAEAARLAAESDKIRAEAAVRAKDDFFAVLSHELRTPLNPALLLATSLADDTALPLHVRADIDVIAKGIALQMQLVDDMLDITRIATGKVRLDLRPIDAHIALRNAYEIVRADAREGQIEVTMDLAATHNCIKADAVRVQQIFWNVLQNSVKFTPPGGVITVRTRNPADKKGALVVEIADTGIGIEPEMLGKVFDAFTQGEHSSAHRFGGLGLGLAITQRLIELQNGKISAESLGRNRGTTFRVEFPLAPSKVRPADEPTAGPSVTPSVKARRILLVEDHEQTRSTLAQLLGQRSHSVVGVTTAAAAREIAAARRCDLVISDLGLPDGDGYALMAELRDAYGLPGIALSGYGTEEDVKRSLTSGFFAHLTKPVDIHALEAAIAVAPPALSARVLT